MTTHIERAIGVADRVVTMVDTGLRGIDVAIAGWPAEFRVIVWEAVADVASRRAAEAKSVHQQETMK